MEGTKGGVVKHILLAKFKDEISPDKIDQLIKQYANLVNLIEPMKAFHWYSSSFLSPSLIFNLDVCCSTPFPFLTFLLMIWMFLVEYWSNPFSLFSLSVVGLSLFS